MAYYYTFVDGSSALLDPPFLLRNIFLVKQSGSHRYHDLDIKGNIHILNASSGLFVFMILRIKHNLVLFEYYQFGFRNGDVVCFNCRMHCVYKQVTVWTSILTARLLCLQPTIVRRTSGHGLRNFRPVHFLSIPSPLPP